jgi:membrane protein YqaA with SNARE-associated domain
VASFTYGGLLGAYLIGLFVPRARERDVIPAMAVAVVAMTALWIAQRAGVGGLAFHGLWFAALGSAVTLAAGWALSRRGMEA